MAKINSNDDVIDSRDVIEVKAELESEIESIEMDVDELETGDIMNKYIGYIKKTKDGRFRGTIGTLHDVGEPDGDKSVFDVFDSPIFKTLDEAIVALNEVCIENNISNINLVPISRGQILWESQLK